MLNKLTTYVMNRKIKITWLISLFLGFACLLSNRLNSQVINTESFDGSTFVPSGWVNFNVAGSALWTSESAGTFPTQTPHSGIGEAKFNSFSASSGAIQALITPQFDLSYIGSSTSVVSLWMYRDAGYATKTDKLDLFINSAANLTGATLLGTIFRNNSMSPIETVIGWHQYSFNIPNTFIGTSNYLILQGTSDYGNNIFIDDLTWTSFPAACAGSPAPGNTLSSEVSICPDIPFNLSLQNNTIGGGVTYQWKSSNDNVTFTNIPGAIFSTLSISQTSATYYKCAVTCSSLSGTSMAVQVGLNNFYDCYCSLTATSAGDSDIGNVTVGALNNGVAAPVLSNPLATGMYNDYTSLPAAELEIGVPIPISLSQITSSTSFYDAWFNVYIDYNHNGTFDIPGEQVFTSTILTDATAPSQTSNILVPATALTGQTRMRISLHEFGSASEPVCGTFGYGEVEDYMVNIICPAMNGPLAPNVSICSGNSSTAIASTTYFGSSLTWYSAATGGAVLATTSTYTTPVLTTNTSYWVSETIGSCPESPRTQVNITVDPVNVLLNPISASCNGVNDGTFSLGTINCGNGPFTYSVDGGSFGSIPTSLSAGTHSVIVQGAGTGSPQSAPISIIITQPSIVISTPIGIDNSACINTLSALLSAQSTLSTFTEGSQVITFDVSAQPVELNSSPGTQFSTATMSALPPGSIVTNVAFSYPNLTSLGTSWASDVKIGYTGALHHSAESGIGAPSSATNFEFIDSLNVDSLDIIGGAINLFYWDSWNDNTGNECNFATGSGVATLTITYDYPTPASVTWWTAPTGGSQIGTGSTLETIGTSVLPTSSILGLYNFYAQGENIGCSSASRGIVTVTLNSPNRTIAAYTCEASYTSPFGQVYDTSGLYYHVIPSTTAACDSTVIIDLTLVEIPVISIIGGTSLTATYDGASATYQWLNCSTGNTVIPGATSATYEVLVNGMYSVIANNGTCTDTSVCVTVVSVGLNSITSDYIVQLSPNPTSGKVLITLAGSMSASVDVFDIQGKVILSLKEVTSGDSISLDSVQSGMYTFKVTNEKGTSTHRILKN
jgi:hypothetical protein